MSAAEDRRPELSYLEEIASVIINGQKANYGIKSMVFYLDYDTSDPLVEPAVYLYGGVDLQRTGYHVTKELTALELIRRDYTEAEGATTPVGSVVKIPCHVETCIKDEGHPANHQNAEGTGFYGETPPKQSGRPGDPG